MAKKTRGRQAGGRNARYAAKHLLPRLALWAGVGVFVCGGMMTCDNTTEPTPVESGYLYAAGYMESFFGVNRFLAKTGEDRTVFPETQTFISADIEPNTGDIFGYTWNYLYRYSPKGEEKFKVQVMTARFDGREYIAYNKSTGLVYFLNGMGRVYRFRSDTGEEVGILGATEMGDAEQFLIDEDDNALWVVNHLGAGLGKFNHAGEDLLVLEDGPYTEVRVEPESNTIIVGVVRSGSNCLRRYTKKGVRVKEIATGLKPKYVGVEPGSGIIWVSNGTAIERYAADGGKLDGISTAGFEFIDFGPDGGAAFLGSPDGYLSAYDTRDLKEVWREKRYSSPNDVHLFKYNEN